MDKYRVPNKRHNSVGMDGAARGQCHEEADNGDAVLEVRTTAAYCSQAA
jgi:hypothetical protein